MATNNSIPYVIPLSSTKPKILTLVPSDPGSRYKCRQLQIQVVGKSKMIKTVLANILDVSKDMQVPPTYLGVFFAYEIGAKAVFDEKKAERQQAYITGEQDVKDLSRLTEQFINQVLLCPNCGLPEIGIQVQQKDIWGTCRACGDHSKLRISNDKFRRYVVNHPPNFDKTQAFNFQQQKKSGKKKNKEKEEGPEEGDEEGEEEGKLETKAEDSSEKPKTEKKEKKDKKSKKDKAEDSGEDNVVWYTDTSEEAAKKRREALLPDAVVKRLETNQNATELQELISDFEKLKLFKTEKNITDDAWIKMIFDAMFAGKTDIKEDIKKHQKVLVKMTRTRAAQQQLLVCIEAFAVTLGDQAKKLLPLILKEFYDNDILAEECILQWHEKDCKNEVVKGAAAPYVKWLKEAEEDEEDDD